MKPCIKWSQMSRRPHFQTCSRTKTGHVSVTGQRYCDRLREKTAPSFKGLSLIYVRSTWCSSRSPSLPSLTGSHTSLLVPFYCTTWILTRVCVSMLWFTVGLIVHVYDHVVWKAACTLSLWVGGQPGPLSEFQAKLKLKERLTLKIERGGCWGSLS